MTWFLVLTAVGVSVAVWVFISTARKPSVSLKHRTREPQSVRSSGPDAADRAPRPWKGKRPQRSNKANPKGRYYGRSALVVEDSDTIQGMVGMVLAPEGLELLWASDYSGARRQLSGLHPDLLIVDRDLWLAGGGPDQGTGTMAWPDLGDTPVVLLAGRKPGLPSGDGPDVKAVVRKPFSSDELIAAVDGALAPTAERPACPVCGYPAGQDPARCGTCHAPHHAECWTLNDGCGQCGRPSQ